MRVAVLVLILLVVGAFTSAGTSFLETGELESVSGIASGNLALKRDDDSDDDDSDDDDSDDDDSDDE